MYCQDESERDTAVAQMKATSKRKVEVQRNKGLGEMDADDFWNTVLDPQRRTVIRVHPDDGEKNLHHTLFGGPPEGRRTWMADVASRVDASSLDLTRSTTVTATHRTEPRPGARPERRRLLEPLPADLRALQRQRPRHPFGVRRAQAGPAPPALPDARLETAPRQQAAEVVEGLLGGHRQPAPPRRRVHVRRRGADGRRVPARESH